jgi:hypothetical protein
MARILDVNEAGGGQRQTFFVKGGTKQKEAVIFFPVKRM